MYKFIMKKVAQNSGCVFVYFCGGYKNIFGYNFVAPLSCAGVNN